MTPILWYFFGDTACLMGGGRSGADPCVADALKRPGVDPQAIVDDLGSATAPPGMAGVLARVLATHPNRWPPLPRWTTSDWPLGWQVRFVGPAESGLDALIFQPGVVAFRWPPVGGESLNVSLANARPALSDPHTVRFGDALLQAADRMVTTPAGRQLVKDASVAAGSIDRVDAFALMAQIDRDLLGPKAPPPTFSARLNSALATTETRVGVNVRGGVEMEIGWVEVPDGPGPLDSPHVVGVPDRPNAPEVDLLMMRDYPCGGFTS